MTNFPEGSNARPKHVFLSLLLTIACFFFGHSGPVQAMPITFTHGGSGSGTLGGVPFNSQFTILAQAETEDISAFGTGYSLQHLFARIAIEGLGSFDLLSPTRTYVNNRIASVGFARGAGPDLFNGPAATLALSVWDMRSSLGTIHGRGSQVQWGLAPIRTSGGTLYFNTQMGTPASFAARVALPGPASWLLVALCLPLLHRRASRRHR